MTICSKKKVFARILLFAKYSLFVRPIFYYSLFVLKWKNRSITSFKDYSKQDSSKQEYSKQETVKNFSTTNHFFLVILCNKIKYRQICQGYCESTIMCKRAWWQLLTPTRRLVLQHCGVEDMRLNFVGAYPWESVISMVSAAVFDGWMDGWQHSFIHSFM